MLEIKNGYYVDTETGEFLHRKIAEMIIGRKLIIGEEVHHINGDKLDNRPDNLEVLSAEEHRRRHYKDLSVAEFFELLADRVKNLPDDEFDYAVVQFKHIFKFMKFNEHIFRRYCGR